MKTLFFLSLILQGTDFKIIKNKLVFDNGKYKFTLDIGWVYPRFSIHVDLTRDIIVALNRLFNDMSLE